MARLTIGLIVVAMAVAAALVGLASFHPVSTGILAIAVWVLAASVGIEALDPDRRARKAAVAPA